MAFSQENEKWILEQIQQAMYPNGWKKIANWLRYWGVLGVLVTATISLIAMALTLGIFAVNRTNEESRFRGSTEARLTQIETSLEALRLKQVSGSPTDPKSIKEAKALIQSARSNQLRLNKDAVTDAGERFVEVGNKNPDAWDAALEFLKYRTYLNSVTVNLGPQVAITKEISTNFQVPYKNVPEGMNLTTIGLSNPSDAAQLRLLSEPNLNTNLAASPTFLVVRAQNVLLDGLYAKKVIFTDSHIIYKGGLVTLDQVYFLNCTFEILRDSLGQTLAKAILSSDPATRFSKNDNS